MGSRHSDQAYSYCPFLDHPQQQEHKPSSWSGELPQEESVVINRGPSDGVRLSSIEFICSEEKENGQDYGLSAGRTKNCDP